MSYGGFYLRPGAFYSDFDYSGRSTLRRATVINSEWAVLPNHYNGRNGRIGVR